MKFNEPVKQTVGGTDFYITPFPALKAANISGELVSTLAPLFAIFVPLFGENADISSILDMDVETITKAVSSAVAGGTIEGDKIEELVRKLLLQGNIVVEIIDENGDKDQRRMSSDELDMVFTGEIQNMFVLCYHVIQVNFGGFFENLASQSGSERSIMTTTIS